MAFGKRSVLIIEEDEVTLAQWLGVLRAAGISGAGERTVQAAGWYLSVQNWARAPFDCVLLGVSRANSPELRALEQLFALDPPPIIGAVSARVDNALAMALARRGICLLTKPVQPVVLLDLVAQRPRFPSTGDASAAPSSLSAYADAFGFSRRERQVLECCVIGHGREETAELLGIAVGSVHRIWGRILARTGHATQDAVLRHIIRQLADIPARRTTALAS